MGEWTIEAMRDSDWTAVCAIYREGIATGDATFETDSPGWSDWDAAHLRHSRIVARNSVDGAAGGWAALKAVSRRAVYSGVAEVSIYVAEAHRGQGVGSLLLARLVAESEQHGIWTLQAGIFPENLASVALHERMGFRQVGRRERIGRQDGRWRDTVLLERRSNVVGL
jgi:L-amino acid N-acyltransferase YncA